MLRTVLSSLQLPWVIYALGQGRGALSRSLAIANFAALKRQVFILSNSAYAPLVQQLITEEQISIQAIPPAATEDEVTFQVMQLFSIAPFVLIVDALPSGFYNELTNILPALSNLPKILIFRKLKPEYVVSQNLINLINNHYDAVIIPGLNEDPLLVDLLNVRQTSPWLIRSSKELPDRQMARTFMGLGKADDTTTTILVLASGEAAELEVYGYIADTISQACPWVTVRCISHIPPSNCSIELWVSHWPEIDCLPAAHLVIGEGDYSTVYQCQALKIPLIAFPWTRQDDIQRKRLEKILALNETSLKIVTSAEEALGSAFDSLNQIMENQFFSKQNRREYESQFINGAEAGLKFIEEVLEDKWNQVAYAAMKNNVEQFKLRRDSIDT